MQDCKAPDSDVLAQLAEVVHHFAHATVVKCSIGMLDSAQAPNGMYRKCWNYLKGELPALSPDIVVTQGDKAADALQRCVLELGSISACRGECDPKCSDRCKEVLLCGRRVLWIRTFHPARRPRSKTVSRPFDIEGGTCWACYTAAAAKFMCERRAAPDPG
jgi:hypothetical protein